MLRLNSQEKSLHDAMHVQSCTVQRFPQATQGFKASVLVRARTPTLPNGRDRGRKAFRLVVHDTPARWAVVHSGGDTAR